jgi:hypothetical protein
VLALAVLLFVVLRDRAGAGDDRGNGSAGATASGSTTAGGGGGLAAGELNATGPWRLVVGDHAVGADPGCTFRVVDADAGRTVRTFESVFAKTQQIQMRERGRFRFRVSSDSCLLEPSDGAGERSLPFDWPAGQGDSDAFSTDGKVVVSPSLPQGTTSCDVLLRSVADGHLVAARTMRRGQGEVTLDPGGSAAVYFGGTACDLAVRKPG